MNLNHDYIYKLAYSIQYTYQVYWIEFVNLSI